MQDYALFIVRVQQASDACEASNEQQESGENLDELKKRKA